MLLMNSRFTDLAGNIIDSVCSASPISTESASMRGAVFSQVRSRRIIAGSAYLGPNSDCTRSPVSPAASRAYEPRPTPMSTTVPGASWSVGSTGAAGFLVGLDALRGSRLSTFTSRQILGLSGVEIEMANSRGTPFLR